MKVTMKDYGEHGSVSYFGQDALDRLLIEYDHIKDAHLLCPELPEGVTRREFIIEAEPPFPKVSRG